VIEGYFILITDFYSSGLLILKELKITIEKKMSDQSFLGQRDYRAVFFEFSQQLLLEVKNNSLSVKKSPIIGWFNILYSDLDTFLLPFPQVQGLNSAWQWYVKGIEIPSLGKKIHPFYGMYFPTRFDHLKLFNNWLKRYEGEKLSAIDVGIGCGVLSFQMLNNGFAKVYGTDSNPNSIIGLSKDSENNKVELFYGDLFADCQQKSELIVFNPPWLPAPYNAEGIDKAIYYDEELFPRFFEEAQKHLTENGKIILLFSNLAQITNQTEDHPIKKELSENNRFKKELFIRKKVAKASKKTQRNQNWRDKELVELWVLGLNDNTQDK